jgi:hypothetical protein
METEPLNYQYSKYFIIFAILLIFFNALDIVSTKIALEKGSVEGNPFARSSFDKIGYGWSSVIKMIGAIFCICVLLFVAVKNPLLGVGMLIFITGFTASVVFGNFLVLAHILGWATI